MTRVPEDSWGDTALSTDDIPAGLRNDDPRLRTILPPALHPHGLRRVVALAEVEDQICPEVRKAIIETARRIEAMALEDALTDLLQAADAEFHSTGRRRPCEQRWLEGMALRIGLVGDPPMTLEEVGRHLGVTRERVRQVMAKHISLPNCRRPYLPQVDRTLALLHDLVPCGADELGARLRAAGITRSQPSFDSLRAAAVFTGRPLDLALSNGLVVRDSREARAVLSTSRKLSIRHGAFRPEQLADDVAIDGWKLTDEDAERYLSSSPEVLRLTGNYFVHTGAGRNRLTSTLRTTLCLHQPLPLSTLLAATRRLYEWCNFRGGSSGREVVHPGAEALRAFCATQDEFVVTGEGEDCLISNVDPLDWREVLGQESRIMVHVLDEAPHRTLDRHTLLARCESRGVRANVATIHLNYHPAFVRLGRNLWTLLGNEPPTEALEELLSRTPRRSRRRYP